MSDMTDAELDRLEGLLANATAAELYRLLATPNNGYLVEIVNALPALISEVRRLRGAIRDELRRLDKHNDGRTHYEGCEKHHPACAATWRLRAALTTPKEPANGNA